MAGHPCGFTQVYQRVNRPLPTTENPGEIRSLHAFPTGIATTLYMHHVLGFGDGPVAHVARVI